MNLLYLFIDFLLLVRKYWKKTYPGGFYSFMIIIQPLNKISLFLHLYPYFASCILTYFLSINSQRRNFWVKGHEYFIKTQKIVTKLPSGGILRLRKNSEFPTTEIIFIIFAYLWIFPSSKSFAMASTQEGFLQLESKNILQELILGHS